ncbi:hypothetical protein HY251_05165 [bacterium]|nr:hypothetical protein [bacterium]
MSVAPQDLDAFRVFLAIFAFFGVKLLGYASAGHKLNAAFDQKANAWRLGFARTAMGFFGGLAWLGIWILFLPPETEPSSGWQLLFSVGLFATRTIEWRITIWLFYASPKRALACSFMGAIWSKILDGPAWLAFLVLLPPIKGAMAAFFAPI